MNLRPANPARPPRPAPNVWDWLGFASVGFFAVFVLLALSRVNFLGPNDLPYSTWGTYLVLIPLPVIGVLAMYSVIRLLTTGWLRREFNRWRYYAHATLVLYWMAGLVVIVAFAGALASGDIPVYGGRRWALFEIFADDGKSIHFRTQPILFCSLVVAGVAAAVSLFIGGVLKYDRRRRGPGLPGRIPSSTKRT